MNDWIDNNDNNNNVNRNFIDWDGSKVTAAEECIKTQQKQAQWTQCFKYNKFNVKDWEEMQNGGSGGLKYGRGKAIFWVLGNYKKRELFWCMAWDGRLDDGRKSPPCHLTKYLEIEVSIIILFEGKVMAGIKWNISQTEIIFIS